MRFLKLTLAYEGTNYHGWQVQRKSDGPTIQGILQDGLKKLTGEETAVTASGRTDAGVHAWGQVAHLALQSKIPVKNFPRALNNVLPADIVVRRAEEVSADFHACFSAREKTYIYVIYNKEYLSPFWRRYACHITGILDVKAMNSGAKMLEGYHDFRSLCSQKASVQNFKRHLRSCRVRKKGAIIMIEATANGFLYNMVRIIAGTLLEVGKGKLAPASMKDILEARDRKAAGPTAPPQGLCLFSVKYT